MENMDHAGMDVQTGVGKKRREEMEFGFRTAGNIRFGNGVAGRHLAEVKGWGERALVLTGSRPDRQADLVAGLERLGIQATFHAVVGEPTVASVEAAVASGRTANAEFVVAIGGGSVLDTGKAVAAMLGNPGNLADHLEVVGRGLSIEKDAPPVLAIPTTAGTGAEVTMNAVIGVPEHGVKVSLRHPSILPKLVLVDPELMVSAPFSVTRDAGMDALTQLVEAFTSKKGTPVTDGLCREGLSRVFDALEDVLEDGGDLDARGEMAFSSLMSGMALANGGLGAVHGLAGPLGGMIPAAHGAICAALLPAVLRMNLWLSDEALAARFQEVSGFCGLPDRADGIVGWVEAFTKRHGVFGLRALGLEDTRIDELVEKGMRASSMKGNPVPLTPIQLRQIVVESL